MQLKTLWSSKTITDKDFFTNRASTFNSNRIAQKITSTLQRTERRTGLRPRPYRFHTRKTSDIELLALAKANERDKPKSLPFTIYHTAFSEPEAKKWKVMLLLYQITEAEINKISSTQLGGDRRLEMAIGGLFGKKFTS